MDKYELINLADYNQTGAGGTALSYTHKDKNTLVKLYNPGFEAKGPYRNSIPPGRSLKWASLRPSLIGW